MTDKNNEIAVKCNNCKQLVNEDSDYCINCGYPLKIFDKTFYGEKNKKTFVPNGVIPFLKQPVNILITGNCLIFVMMLLPGLINQNIHNNFLFFLPSPPNISILSGISEYGLIFNNGEYWRLISAAYLHASTIHIAFNMIFLKQISSFTSHFFNWQIFFIIYTVAGIFGNIAAVLYNEPVVGASGAIFGIVGSLIVLGKLSKSIFGIAIYLSLGKWTLIMLIIGFLIPGISNAAHLGGLFSGMLMGYLIYHPHLKIQSYSRILYYLFLILTGYSIYMIFQFLMQLFSL